MVKLEWGRPNHSVLTGMFNLEINLIVKKFGTSRFINWANIE